MEDNSFKNNSHDDSERDTNVKTNNLDDQLIGKGIHVYSDD